MGPPAAQPPSRSRTGSKLETKTKHRLTGSVSDVPYSPEELSSGDAPGNGNPSSGASSSAALRDKKFRRRTRSSLGGMEDLVKELDTLAPLKSDSRESALTPPKIPLSGDRPSNSSGPAYPAVKAPPSDPGEDSERSLPVILSGSEAFTGDSSSDKEYLISGQKVVSSKGSSEPTSHETAAKVDSSDLPTVSHPDVVDLETRKGSAVELKAGAYSTNENKDLWICRQCGWTYPYAHPSAKQRRNHKKFCAKLYTGVEVPPGSSDDASSDDELNDKDQHSSAGSSTANLEKSTKVGLKDGSAKIQEVVSRAFTKPTISTDSGSSKNSPVTSPGKHDSPFSSPAKRDSHLTSPAKKETPWGSPIRRSTPVSSPSTYKKGSSPITSPVKRIMSTPVKRNSPPRPDKLEGAARILTAKQQQEEEERKISVKKRIEELERIAGSKPHTWKDYSGEGKKSGELSSSGSPLRHGDDDRRKSGALSPAGKSVKNVEAGERKSADFSPGASGKPFRHAHSARRSGELSSTGSPLSHSTDGKPIKASHAVEVAKFHPASSQVQKSLMEDATVKSPPDSSTSQHGTEGTDSKKSLESKAEISGSTGPPLRVSEGSEEEKAVQDADGDAHVEKVSHEDVAVSPSMDKVQAAGLPIVPCTETEEAAAHTVLADERVEEESMIALSEKGPAQDKGIKKETEASSHSRGPSVILDKGDVSDIPLDSGVVILPAEMGKTAGQDFDPDNAQKVVREPEISTSVEFILKETNTIPVEPEQANVLKDNILLGKDEPSSVVSAPVAVEERELCENSYPTAGDSSDPLAGEVDETSKILVPGHKIALPSDVVTVEPCADKTPSSQVSIESKTIKCPESDNAAGNVSPSPRRVDHDDDTSVLLTKQPAVDPLFVDSQQDRLWEMHSQELTRRDGDASGTDVRESSAQDDDPIQYANGSPLAPEASASGTTSNGNGVNEKGGKVDRPRTPLRSLIAEDDAADKGGDEGAPTGKETPIVSPRGNLFKRIVSGGKPSPTKPSTSSMYEKKSQSKPFLSSCICCSPVK